MNRSVSTFAVLSLSAPLIFVGCTSSNPRGAFEGVHSAVARQSGYSIRRMADDATEAEMARAVDALVQAPLTAESAVTVALLNNRSLQAQFEELGFTQADLAQASRPRNPVISGSWRLPLSGGGRVNADYGLAQDFLSLLLLPARKKLAAQQLQHTQQRISQSVLEFAESVQIAFYTLQAQQQFVERLALIVEVEEAAADISRRQFEAGNINQLTHQSQQLALAQVRLDRVRVNAEVRAQREKLNRLLGLSGAQTGWQINTELTLPSAEEMSPDDVEAVAVRQRLDLAAARGDVEMAAYALQLKRRTRHLPGVNVGLNAERDRDGSWVLGPTLDLELPLFDQGQPELARLSAHYRQARHRFEALSTNIRSEVREARDALLAAREVAQSHQTELLPQYRQQLAETLLHYNAMQIGNHELLLAKQREQQAEQAAIEALRDYWIARSRFHAALGGNLSPAAPSAVLPPQAPAKAPTEHRHETH